MRRLLFLLVFPLAIVVAALALPLCGAARAGDDAGPAGPERADAASALRRRVEIIRNLPPEDQRRLRDALARFKSMPKAERQELRRRAAEVGSDRLRELIGRNVKRLRRRNQALRHERDEIVRLLGGTERFAGLSSVERGYLVGLGVRSFQKHVRRTLLDIAGPGEMNAFSRLPRAERKAKLELAVRQLGESLFAAETPESRAAILALSPKEQARRRRELLSEHRLSLVPSFVTAFETQRVRPFLLLPPEQRRQAAERWATRARWFEIRHRLEHEVGVSRDVLRLLSDLGPEDWARVRDEYDRSVTMDPVERRFHLEDEIREVHGRAAIADEPRHDGDRPGLRRLMRDARGQRRRRRDDDAR